MMFEQRNQQKDLTMSDNMLGSLGEDLGLVLDFVTRLRHGGNDFRERAKKFLRSTLFTLALGDGQSKEHLLAAFSWVGNVARAFVMSEQFRFATAREDVDLEFIDGTNFDHDPSSDEVLEELKKRGLEEPTGEDALRYGATCPEGKDKRAVVFLHKKNLWRGPGGLSVLVFEWDGSGRRLDYYLFADAWYRRNYRFAARRLRK